MKKTLIKNLRATQDQIKPSAEWKARQREILMSQISSQWQTEDRKLAVFRNLSFFPQPLLKSAVSGIIVVCLVFGWMFGVDASKQSLPGDILYPIKITSEQIELSLSFKQTRKANLEMEYANRRFEEFKKVKTNFQDQSKAAAPLKSFQQNIKKATSRVASLTKEPQNDEVNKLVTDLEKKTSEYIAVLKEENKNEENNDLKEDLKAALDVSTEANEAVVSIIVTKHEEGEGLLTDEEIKQKVEEKLAIIEQEILDEDEAVNQEGQSVEEGTESSTEGNADESKDQENSESDTTDDETTATEQDDQTNNEETQQGTTELEEVNSVDQEDVLAEEERDTPEENSEEIINKLMTILAARQSTDETMTAKIDQIKILVEEGNLVKAYQLINQLEKELIATDLVTEEDQEEGSEEELFDNQEETEQTLTTEE